MSLPSFAIRHRPIVVTVVTLLMVWGVLSYMTMPRLVATVRTGIPPIDSFKMRLLLLLIRDMT